ncbi:hypothetical protein NI459_00290 [Acinetobacter schindleri]|uniref:hypothetical protein n=1 Tax=Acinetobacter schindleri TaxID=108981 RepID=UPI00209B0B80|nr:hypothetical protein [Acinetobacter schindleri]MCO8066096.1 hypothetical protein [Acinetobacter schindleri]
MNPALQTVYSDLIDEIFSNTVKTKNEFKIQSWRRKAEALRSVDIFQYKLMSAIIDTYENKNEKARQVTQSALLLTQDNSYKAMAYRVIGNSYAHEGNCKGAMDSYWNAYNLTMSPKYFYSFFNTGTTYDLYDGRMENMKSLSLSDQENIKKELTELKQEIEDILHSNINLEVYRDVLSAAYKVFFSHCAGSIIRFPSVSDSNVSTILFNPDLDLAIIEVLNDEMSSALVNLLDKYEYEELLNFPIIFSSEDYSKNAAS